jgi:hypothetical protein
VIAAGTILLVLGGTVWFFVLMYHFIELQRWPFAYLRWKPYLKRANDPQRILIGIRRRDEKINLVSIDLKEERYLEDLVAARQLARDRAAALNRTEKTIRRLRLP